MIVLTNVAVADEPAHSASTKPTLTMSARPPRSTSCTVGAMSWVTTSGENALLKPFSSWFWARDTVPGPNSRATNPRAPSRARNSEGRLSSCQNAVSADRPRMRSFQALRTVRLARVRPCPTTSRLTAVIRSARHTSTRAHVQCGRGGRRCAVGAPASACRA